MTKTKHRLLIGLLIVAIMPAEMTARRDYFRQQAGKARKASFKEQMISLGAFIGILAACSVWLTTKMYRERLIRAVTNGDYAQVKQLIENGWDVNYQGFDKHTALVEAADKGHVKIVELLIASGADVNAKNYDGWSALHAAALGGHLEVAKTIVKNGGDVFAIGSRGISIQKTAREVAGAQEIADYLQLVEDFYAVNEKKMAFDEFVKKYLDAHLADIFDLLHLGTKEFADQFIAFVDEKELLTPAGYDPNDLSDNKKRWFYFGLAKRSGSRKCDWIRKCFGYLDGENYASAYDKAVRKMIDGVVKIEDAEGKTKILSRFSPRDRKELIAKMIEAWQQKKGFSIQKKGDLKMPKVIRMPEVTKTKDPQDYAKNGFIDTKIYLVIPKK